MSRPATAPNRAREYETIYILRPDVDAESAEKVASRMDQAVAGEKGRLTKVELWGRRRLAYEIAKHKRGVYIYMKYVGSGKVVSEVERNLRLADGVLRYQTILVRSDVPLDNVDVNADEVKFERVELPPLEDEKEDSRERQLGFIENERRERYEEDVVDAVEPAAAEAEGEASEKAAEGEEG